ncbi:sialate O-acetylesterase [Dyadobacter pollutisoli]|uniref:T9SS type A sorting domain-containing protein n=1 Tax=Dyadobacter pollutisoli TaxID=2910158 RepID=A0A9E8NBW4_9BACT|nr:sialate O-acetylesterase [Dyadobacter pollutisoli]WAC13810.1 T9SS type A sorting domain-containing protein [Dyadobacter pollutisoli]
MNKNLLPILTIVLLFTHRTILGQIVVTYPTERAVFQRSASNEANVYIGGFITEPYNSIEARFIPRVSGEGEAAPIGGGWTVINTPVGGQFLGSITVKGGWYRLEVRGLRNGTVLQTTSIERVGVGEVFVVAGQSNATGGDANPNGPGAAHDQVNSVNFQNFNPATLSITPYADIQVPCPVFEHLDANVKTAPFGNYAWCWGAFGDMIYQKLKVPVMIFNAGWSSSGIDNWQKSINPGASPISAFGYQYPAGLPFGHLRIALNNYIAQLGVRAVLWHQGETDNYLEQVADNTFEKYKSGLWEVISASRSLSGKSNLAWLVSRASRFTVNGLSRTSDNVINAQNELINNDGSYPHIYPGPETDPYYSIEYRSDQVHFRGDGVTPSSDGNVYSGLIHLAQFWADKINDGFLNQSVPYGAIPPPLVTVANENTALGTTFSGPAIPAGSIYNWLKIDDCNQIEHEDRDWTVGIGYYKLKIVDANKNTILSPKLYVSGKTLPVTWQYFNAHSTENGRSMLQWATASEYNASHFEVERSTNAVNYAPVKTVQAVGDSKAINEYTYLDEFLVPGTYYYRLKEVDRDGKFDYSRIVSVKLTADVTAKAYPNPVTNKLTLESAGALRLVEVISAAGKKLYSTNTDQKLFELNMQPYPSGLYTVTAGGKTYKIVK